MHSVVCWGRGRVLGMETHRGSIFTCLWEVSPLCCLGPGTCLGCMYYSYLLASPLQQDFRVATPCLWTHRNNKGQRNGFGIYSMNIFTAYTVCKVTMKWLKELMTKLGKVWTAPYKRWNQNKMDMKRNRIEENTFRSHVSVGTTRNEWLTENLKNFNCHLKICSLNSWAYQSLMTQQNPYRMSIWKRKGK